MSKHPSPTTVGRYNLNGFFGTYTITVMRDGDIFYPLTPCCNATGKGMDYEHGVGCRSCYNEVDSVFGTCWVGDDAFAKAIADGELTAA